MNLRNVSTLAGVAIAVGLAGFSATGCRSLEVPTTVNTPDSTAQKCNPCLVVPPDAAELEPEIQGR
ncbi:hypothetical protein [Candidatus Palauibacter sp.]|uniref:hypothetical protein n=1 Tax=Candidatus Palauibacter sp. TaxID=3101350 RepID=UPI003B013811